MPLPERKITMFAIRSLPHMGHEIMSPKYAIGDRLQLKDARIGNPDVIVERVDGPSLYYGCKPGDRWIYYVYEPARNERYPVCQGSLETTVKTYSK